MDLAQFNYHLPTIRIAQEPLKPRDRSRLLVYLEDILLFCNQKSNKRFPGAAMRFALDCLSSFWIGLEPTPGPPVLNCNMMLTF